MERLSDIINILREVRKFRIYFDDDTNSVTVVFDENAYKRIKELYMLFEYIRRTI